MKKIIAILLLVSLLAFAFVGCGKKDETPAGEKAYTLSLAVDSTFSGVKTANTVVALVTDADGKIVACRFDSAESSLTVAEGELVTNPAVSTKVEIGDGYTGMNAGSWAKQAKAFEEFVIGKTAAEVAALEITKTLVTGCTMTNSMNTFKSLLAKAFAYGRKVSFNTDKTFTLGVSIVQSLSGSLADESASVAASFAAAVLVDGKVVAGMIDENSRSFTISYNADDEAVEATEASYPGTKNEQGEAYGKMDSGFWFEQAQAFANTANGKTVAELANLADSGDALKEAGCSIYAGNYKTALIKAATAAR